MTPIGTTLAAHNETRALADPGRRACGKCGAVYRNRDLERGRGRSYGEHPEHFFAPCGHNVTWYGSRPANAEQPR